MGFGVGKWVSVLLASVNSPKMGPRASTTTKLFPPEEISKAPKQNTHDLLVIGMPTQKQQQKPLSTQSSISKT